jgi:hypothetical protein
MLITNRPNRSCSVPTESSLITPSLFQLYTDKTARRDTLILLIGNENSHLHIEPNIIVQSISAHSTEINA